MVHKVTRFAFLLALLVLSASLVTAQDALVSGETVTGEITDDAFAVEYSYEGTAGQIVVLELFPVDVLADYDNPAIVLLDSAGEELMTREGFGATTAVWQLPADDTYTVVATRRDGAEGTSVGEYTLTLTVPQELVLDEPVEGSMGADSDVYFTYTGEEDFNVFFARQGEFAPEVSVNVIDFDITPGSLDSFGGAYGGQVTQASFGTFAGGETYIIKLGEPLFAFNFGDPTADYTIQLFASE